MLKEEVASGTGGRILIMDSITKISADDDGVIAVSASHGGASSGEFALAVPLTLAFFNDAGIGKDQAGIAALPMLEEKGVAAGTVAHVSARIGDAEDMWQNGVISHLNLSAREMGLKEGVALKEALLDLIKGH